MNILAKFLQAKEPLFDHALKQLEERTGQSGVDAKLVADIATRVAETTSQLDLSSDASGQELYQALLQRVQSDDERLARSIGGQDITSLADMVPLIMARIEKLDMPRDGWFLKIERAQELLRQTPPQAIMSRLGYGSVEQLLAGEDLFEIYTALRFAQPANWLNRFDATYTSLQGEDFEPRPIKLLQFDAEKWGDIAEPYVAKKLHNITHSKEMGVIAAMPVTETHMPGVTLKVMPLILHYYNEIRLYSAFFKLMQAKANFGEVLATTLIADPSPIKVTQGRYIHWRVIQRYFGKLSHEKHPEIFEPHVQPEDLHWRRAEELLCEIDPELEFWKELDYVATFRGDDIVTFNLMDVSLSYSNQLGFADRYIYHFRESLWNEIFGRYLGQDNLREQILLRLDNDLIAPEKVDLGIDSNRQIG